MRRRLFQPVSGTEAHVLRLDAVASALSQMCQGQPQEFPAERREAEYERRLKRTCLIRQENHPLPRHRGYRPHARGARRRFELDRRARGSHEIWYNPLTHKRTAMPSSRPVPTQRPLA